MNNFINIDLNPNRSENVHYNFSDYFAYIKKGILSQYPNYSSLSHWHDDVEFIYILSGEMKYNINGNIISFHKDEGIFVNARQLHYGFSEKHIECEFICVLLHPLLLCSTQQIEQKFIIPVLSNSSFSYFILHKEIDWENNILNAVKQIYNCLNENTFQLQVQSLFNKIWIELYNHIPKEKQKSNKISHQLSSTKDMIIYIQKNYKEKITLDDIAIAGAVCKSKCCSLFHKYLNQTPINYLIKYRLQKSIELMSISDMNITEISYDVGFSGTSYFTETFHKHFGCNPSQYRAKYLNNENLK